MGLFACAPDRPSGLWVLGFLKAGLDSKDQGEEGKGDFRVSPPSLLPLSPPGALLHLAVGPDLPQSSFCC